jgi:hypothetical protein
MKETKVQFSNAEMDLMCNSEIILTKNKVVQKVKTLLEELQNEMVEHHKNHSELSLKDVFSINPKISKGENYLGLPYLILDYPRLFKQQDIFAIRTMFWWGHFFSTTLHLSGVFKNEYGPKIIASFDLLAIEKYSIGVNTDPWLHHFGPDNYKEIALITKDLFEEECNKADHLKIAKTISLNDGYPQQKLFENWKELATICFA